MGVGPIPYESIINYARHHEVARIDTDILIRVIRAMDSAYLLALSKKRAVASK